MTESSQNSSTSFIVTLLIAAAAGFGVLGGKVGTMLSIAPDLRIRLPEQLQGNKIDLTDPDAVAEAMKINLTGDPNQTLFTYTLYQDGVQKECDFTVKNCRDVGQAFKNISELIHAPTEKVLPSFDLTIPAIGTPKSHTDRLNEKPDSQEPSRG